MSPINQLSVLAFAAGALAVPGFRDYGHGHGHDHGHGHNHWHGHASGSVSGAPWGIANATGIYGSTGFSTGVSSTSSSPVAPVSNSYTGPVVTVSPIPASSSLASYADAESTSECTTDVTITTTEQTTIYVTATSSNSSSVEVSATDSSVTTHGPYTTTTLHVNSTYWVTATSGTAPGTGSSRSTSTVVVQSTVYYTPSSSEASPVQSSTSSTSSAAAYTPSTPAAYSDITTASSSSSSAEVSPVSESSSSAPAPITYSAPAKQHSYSAYSSPAASSSSAAPVTSSSAASPVAYSTSSTTSSSAAASSTASSSSGGKRGLAYNDASLTECFMGSSEVSFAYNWGSSASGFTPTSQVNYIPLLWGTSSDFTDSWSDNAAAAIKAGSTTLFGFNEPDLSTQANLSPEDAATAWKQYMEPFAGQAKLCAPAVTNGGGEMGLTWLSNFLSACDGCTIDCVSIHWYASSSLGDYFKQQVTNATQIGGGRPVYVSEFGATDGSDTDISNFLEDVMPWMDSQDGVAGYAYFMVSDGLLVSGTEPSSYGSTYMSYT